MSGFIEREISSVDSGWMATRLQFAGEVRKRSMNVQSRFI